MTLQRLWTNIDTMPDLALAARLAVAFAGFAALCAFILGVRWVVRKWKERQQRLSFERVERAIAMMKDQALYVGPVYWPAMDKLRKLWVEREERGG